MYHLYFAVFHCDFNLGFGRATTDICATCVSFKRKLKDLKIKQQQQLDMIHRRKAQAFYDKLNDVQDSMTMCFDIMENLVLPKTPICESYYSCQLYLHVLCIVWHVY